MLDEKTSGNDDDQQQQRQQPSSRSDVTMEEFQDGVVLLHNVVTPAECRRIRDLSEAMGYSEDAPVSLGRNIRQNESCVWLMDDAVNRQIFDRVQAALPSIKLQSSSIENRNDRPIGLNHRWRLYKYNPKDIFKFHTDGAWSDSGMDEAGQYNQDLYHGKALSFQTFLIYLNDDFKGGATRFQAAKRGGPQSISIDANREEEGPSVFEVQPKEGSVVCFYHGFHPLSPLHEGALVYSGTKYVARTDVLFELTPEMQQQQR